MATVAQLFPFYQVNPECALALALKLLDEQQAEAILVYCEEQIDES